MIIFFLALLSLQTNAQTPELKAQQAEVVPSATPMPTDSPVPAKESSDYEVDYEEEPGTEEIEEPVEEKPIPAKEKKQKGKGKKNLKESVTQGSRAEKKIAPMMKSETKSIYKKNGKSLDVDSD